METTQLVVLTNNSLSIFEEEDKVFHLCFKANESKNACISWSSNNSQILAYSYEKGYIVTKVYRQCIDGTWTMDKNE